jgi:hypothetical protein
VAEVQIGRLWTCSNQAGLPPHRPVPKAEDLDSSPVPKAEDLDSCTIRLLYQKTHASELTMEQFDDLVMEIAYGLHNFRVTFRKPNEVTKITC